MKCQQRILQHIVATIAFIVLLSAASYFPLRFIVATQVALWEQMTTIIPLVIVGGLLSSPFAAFIIGNNTRKEGTF